VGSFHLWWLAIATVRLLQPTISLVRASRSYSYVVCACHRTLLNVFGRPRAVVRQVHIHAPSSPTARPAVRPWPWSHSDPCVVAGFLGGCGATIHRSGPESPLRKSERRARGPACGPAALHVSQRQPRMRVGMRAKELLLGLMLAAAYRVPAAAQGTVDRLYVMDCGHTPLNRPVSLVARRQCVGKPIISPILVIKKKKKKKKNTQSGEEKRENDRLAGIDWPGDQRDWSGSRLCPQSIRIARSTRALSAAGQPVADRHRKPRSNPFRACRPPGCRCAYRSRRRRPPVPAARRPFTLRRVSGP